MKKQLLPFIVLLSFSVLSSAQTVRDYCNSSRYDTEVFSTDTISSDLTFGSNTDYMGNNTVLTMDIYQPTGDTASIRPLIIWAHGGSFVGGTKNDVDVVALSNHFAKRGYVCASINYRLGLLPNQTSATQAVYRAVQDLKAAIRFFRKDAATTNTYRIDPNTIFAGGSSAGAFMALHLAYMDQPSELPVGIDTTTLGGIEGTSGNPGYDSHVNAIVNLCGALGDTSWMHPGDIPVCSMHGTADNVVPYATAMLYLFGSIPILVVNGSYSVSQQANRIGLTNVMYTFAGANHVPYVSDALYMDTTVRFVSNFLYSYLGCTPTDPDPLPNTFISTSTADLNQLSDDVMIYPNPASDQFTIETKNSSFQKSELTDLTGRVVRTIAMNGLTKVSVSRENLSSGIYFLKMYKDEKTVVQKISFR